MKKNVQDKLGYFTFTIIGCLLVVIGVLMKVFNFASSFDIGLKYGPTDKSSVTGDLVTILGVILLSVVLVFYLKGRKKRTYN